MIFGGFTFASEVLLGEIAGFYGFFIPEAEKQTSLADFVQARLRGKPILGDHITFEDIELVIQDIQGERITKVGLEFEPWGGFALVSASPAGVASHLLGLTPVRHKM